MYYPDLTLYRYLGGGRPSNALNIGWLDPQHPFPTNKPSEELLDALFERCLDPDAGPGAFINASFALIRVSKA
jgi:hypothetical protein